MSNFSSLCLAGIPPILKKRWERYSFSVVSSSSDYSVQCVSVYTDVHVSEWDYALREKMKEREINKDRLCKKKKKDSFQSAS